MPPTDDHKALVCPMDWGIGHASRCVPVIQMLTRSGFRVVVAASGRPLEFLKRECPGIPVVEFPGTVITYPRNGRFAWKMARNIPGLLLGIWREHQVLKKIVRETSASLVISDNRYGCWHPSVPSIFMTHQLEIRVPAGIRFAGRLLKALNYWFISRYDECWIPDFETHRGLAGALSHPAGIPGNAHYIGILSRFSARLNLPPDAVSPRFDLLVMLSGPEPQRTILEEKILMQLVHINLQVALVRGVPETDEAYVLDGRVHVFSHLGTERMEELIRRSSTVICRSGYSSIMDVVTLGKHAIFIPTPGQTEQEYLSRYLMEKKIYFSITQKDFDLLYAVEMSKNYPGMVIRNDYSALSERIGALKIRLGSTSAGQGK